MYGKGLRAILHYFTRISALPQLDFLLQQAPLYILTYPSNLLALIRRSQERNIFLPFLQAVNTFGELVTDEIRKACEDLWHIPLIDTYSSKEAGIIALQCPHNNCYHVQSENVLLEVLDEQNNPCQPGQVGRVVITVLHNFAMPLIRYELGDLAEVGPNCSCGRNLQVLSKILGRQRNMMTLPNGKKVWPNYIISDWVKLAPILQIQVVQRSLHELEIRMVVARDLTMREEDLLLSKINQDFKGEFLLYFKYLREIPRSPGGKYEDFISSIV